MSDYIEREKAKDAVLNIVGWEKIAKYVDEMSKHPSTKDIDYYDALIDAEDVIDDLPSEDVAPIVRCKDCKHWQPSEYGVVEQPYCKHLGYKEETGLDIQIGNENDYCSFGERKDDD